MLARWTNGRYRSTVHRVILDREAIGPRHSVAFFANPTFDVLVEPLPSCCAPAPGRPSPRFEPVTAGQYISQRLGLMYSKEEEVTRTLASCQNST
jgi:isopenicillin N synthase-like dioxygenase